MTGLIVLIVLGALYFLPTIIASNRHRSDTGLVFLLNFLAGWTMIGWVAALVWSCLNETPRPTINQFYLPNQPYYPGPVPPPLPPNGYIPPIQNGYVPPVQNGYAPPAYGPQPPVYGGYGAPTGYGQPPTSYGPGPQVGYGYPANGNGYNNGYQPGQLPPVYGQNYPPQPYGDSRPVPPNYNWPPVQDQED